jgi:hypothetical protein
MNDAPVDLVLVPGVEGQNAQGSSTHVFAGGWGPCWGLNTA